MFHLFQVTIGENHSCELEALHTELKQLQISPKKITLYYAVHTSTYDDIVTNPKDPMTEDSIIITHFRIRMISRFLCKRTCMKIYIKFCIVE